MGLFNRKQKQEGLSPQQIGDTLMGVLITVCTDVVENQETDVISGTLVLNEKQQVTNVENLTVNGDPKIPSPDVIAEVNEQFASFADLPIEQKVHKMHLTFENQGGNFELDYFDKV